MKKRYFVFCSALFLLAGALSSPVFAQKIKVACVGNSITEGIGASSGSTNYPSVLQKDLGTVKYEVTNFGASGRTLMKNGKEFDGSASSYWDHERYQNALRYNPDIVVIKLGTNDAKKINWDNIKSEYVGDYIELVNSFSSLSSHPKIYICYPLPLFGPGNWINDDKVMTDEMMPMIDQVAEATGATIIDCHSPFEGKGYLTGDKIHPNDNGYILLANIIAHAIAPEADIPALPDDLFLRIAEYDKSDSKTAMESSVDGLDASPLWDNDANTVLETPFSDEQEYWFAAAMPRRTCLTAYAITSGKDASNAPMSWKLQARTQAGTSWRTINEQKNVVFGANETKIFDENIDALTYDWYRLSVTAVNGGSSLAIAELQLFGYDKPLRSSLMNKSNGGTMSAQFNTNSNEGYANLGDGNIGTKYCTEISGGNSIWMRYDLPEAVKVGGYTLISANDSPDRDPSEWTLYGSVDGQKWEVLDVRKNQLFLGRYTMLEYPVVSEQAYKSFRLNVTGKTGLFQLAEWQLFKAPDGVGLKENVVSGFTIRTDNTRLLIESRADVAGHYELFSLSGQCLSKGKIEAGTTRCEYLSSGTYLIALDIKGQREVRKVIIGN
ncbi:GDSL-type esterase/lipase family protein [Bacteroides sp.]